MDLSKPDPRLTSRILHRRYKQASHPFPQWGTLHESQQSILFPLATSALSKPGNTSANQFGFNVTLTTANRPGFNTMGLTIARVDIAADGVVPLHTHPRASKVTTCLKDALLVGFVDTTKRVNIHSAVKAWRFICVPKWFDSFSVQY